MDSLFRIIKQLGCSRGCGEGRRENEALKLKDAIMKSLKVLHDLSECHFVQYCEMLVQTHSVQEVIDIFHAFFGFCSETTAATATFSSISSHLTAFPCKNNTSNDHLQKYKSGYLNNFGLNYGNKG